jgi:hypothetical protein
MGLAQAPARSTLADALNIRDCRIRLQCAPFDGVLFVCPPQSGAMRTSSTTLAFKSGTGGNWGRTGSLLNGADLTPYFEVNFLSVPEFPPSPSSLVPEFPVRPRVPDA